MKYAVETIAQDYLRYKRTVQAMEAELQHLPRGNLTCRTIHQRRYCYLQFRDEQGIVRNRHVPKQDIESVQALVERRNFLNECIKVYQLYIKVIEKTFPQLKSLTNAVLQHSSSKDCEKPYLTSQGDYVRSKSEVIIANELYNHQISYVYEKPLSLEGCRYPLHPDFTICTPGGKTVYWEHCGLMDNEDYRSKWNWRKQMYERSGISEWNKNLIVTYESKNSEFSVEDIRHHIACLLEL